MSANNDHKLEDDASDFLKLMQEAGVTPLKHDKVTHHNTPKKSNVKTSVSAQPTKKPDPFSDECELEELLAGDDVLSYRTHGIQKSTFRRFRNGRFPIVDELDLHGLNSQQARHLLLDFLDHTLTGKNHCVRIIHGKGHRSTDNKAILKTKVNHWLKEHQRVLAFHSCTQADGGTGAVYVLLRSL